MTNDNDTTLSDLIDITQRLEAMQRQRDQVLHLLAGGELTEEAVVESGLGVGVLSEQRHHEYMRTKAEAERDKLKADNARIYERSAQQLAACDVAAISDTVDTFAKSECPKDSPFWSPAYESVRRRTVECIKLRADNARLAAALRMFADHFHSGWCDTNNDNPGVIVEKASKIANDALSGSTALRDLLAPTIAILDEARTRVTPEFAAKIERELARLRAIKERGKE
jgi:hypothetical protein